MMGFIDLHNHCLWGMDDGAESFEESCRMLKLAAEDGITTLAATPHVYPGLIPFDRELYDLRLERLRRWVSEENLPLTILEGAEIWYTDMALPMLRSGRIPTIGSTSRVLVEFSPQVSWKSFVLALEGLFRAGYIPVVAHIERYRKLYGHIPGLLRLREEMDVCFQVNAATITRRNAPPRQIFLRRMLKKQAIDLIATDAHHDRCRTPEMGAAFSRLERCYGPALAQALTQFSPEQPDTIGRIP